MDQYVVHSLSYLRDTTDFINKLRDIQELLADDAILFTFDVEKLYPSVPREEGLAACQKALEMRSKPLIPTDFVMDMIKTVLHNNNFTFGDRNYLQTDGVRLLVEDIWIRKLNLKHCLRTDATFNGTGDKYDDTGIPTSR